MPKGTSIGPPKRIRVGSSVQTIKTQGTGPDITVGVPSAAVGNPIPYVLGRRRIRNYNVLSVFNLVPIKETKTEVVVTEDEVHVGGGIYEVTKVTKTVTTTYIIGYTLDVQIGICLGPGVKLIGIYADDKLIWGGNVGPTKAEFTLDENDTFVSGAQCVFYGGNFDQALEPLLTAANADAPAYVGVAYLILRGIRADATFLPLSFEVTRYPNDLGLPGATNQLVSDLNPMSALYDVVTNSWGAGGLDPAAIDTAAFTTAATTLKDEGNALSLVVEDENPVKGVIQVIQDQINSFIFQNPNTGLLSCKLIRKDNINYSTVKKLNDGNVTTVRNFNKGGWQDTAELLVGKFVNRSEGYIPDAVLMNNTAIVSNAGRGKRNATVEFPYVMTQPLAVSLTGAALERFASPLFSGELVASRYAADLLPGDPFLLSWEPWKQLNVRCLVTKVRKQPLDANNVVVHFRQLETPDIVLSAAPPDPYDPGLSFDPVKPTAVAIINAPYWIVRERGLTNLQDTASLIYPLFLPTRANDIQFSFSAYFTTVSAGAQPILFKADGVYPTVAQLDGTISKYAAMADGIIPTVTLKNVTNRDGLKDIGLSGVREGELLLAIGDEFFSFESYDEVANTLVLTNVHRALLDTAPRDHADGANAYIFSNMLTNLSDRVPSPPGVNLNWKFTGNTSNRRGVLSDALEYNLWPATAGRTLAPLRPHDTKIDGVRSSSPFLMIEGDNHTVTWRTRSRAAMGVTLTLDAAENSEIDPAGDYQFHTVYIRDNANTVWDCGSTPDTGNANSKVITVPVGIAEGEGVLWVEAETSLGVSLYNEMLPIIVSYAGFISEDSASLFVDEAGTSFFVEEGY